MKKAGSLNLEDENHRTEKYKIKYMTKKFFKYEKRRNIIWLLFCRA